MFHSRASNSKYILNALETYFECELGKMNVR